MSNIAKIRIKLKENGVAETSVFGSGEDLVAMLVGVMIKEETIADLLMIATRDYAETKLLEAKLSEKEIIETSKTLD